MVRKFIWALIIILLAGVAVWAAYNFYVTKQSPVSNAAPLNPPGAVPPTPYYHTVTGNLESITPARVTAITPTSVTVQLSADQTRSFALTGSIPVYTTVMAGQTGRPFSNISVGSMVTVYWHTADPATAVALAFPRDEALSLTPEDELHTIGGTITRLSSSEIALSTNDSTAPLATITLTSDTKLANTVTSGQVGRDLKVGDLVVARGVSTAGGVTKAKAIILLPPPLK